MRPYGYEPDRHTIREPEAEVLRDAATRVLEGESLRSIAKAINDSGARTSTGKLWQAKTLRRALSSPRVAGKRISHDGRTRAADWPPILDAVTYKRVAALLEEKGERARETATTARRYLLGGGVAVCALCGKPLAARPNNTGRRGYACVVDPPTSGCGRIRITAESFEQDVAERALARLLRAENRDRLGGAISAAHDAADQARADLDDIRARLEQVGRDYADGNITATEMHAASERLRERLTAARAAVRLGDRLQNVAADTATDLVAWWEGASVEQQSALLRLLIDRVEVSPARVRGSKLYDPDRVAVTWRSM